MCYFYTIVLCRKNFQITQKKFAKCCRLPPEKKQGKRCRENVKMSLAPKILSLILASLYYCSH